MLAGFGWILKTGVRANLVTVTDDDCVMNVLDINTWYRETLIEPFDLFCGLRFNPTGKPIRWTQSKWYIYKLYHTIDNLLLRALKKVY